MFHTWSYDECWKSNENYLKEEEKKSTEIENKESWEYNFKDISKKFDVDLTQAESGTLQRRCS